MEIIKGKPMNPYGVLLLVSVVFFILSFWLFINKDESGGVKALEVAGDVKTTLGSVENTQSEIRKETHVLADVMTQTLSDLSKRLEVLEKKPDPVHTVNFHVPTVKVEPIEITIVQKLPAPPPNLAPPKQEVFTNKKVKPGHPLSKRAQLIPTENN